MKLAKAKGSVRPENGSKVDEINEKNDIEWGYLEELGSLPDMPIELIPTNHGFATYVDSIASAYSCQRSFPATMLLLSLCGLIGSKAGVNPYKKQDVVFYPNTWGGVVAPSGADKSPILNKALSPLMKLNEAIDKQYMSDLAKRKVRIELLEKQVKEAIKNGDEPDGIAKLKEKLEALKTCTGRHLVVNDTTAEALGELMTSNSGGLINVKDELAGTIVQWDRDNAQGAREFFIESWEGGRSYLLHRIKRGRVYIPSSTLSMIGGIQPAKLSRFVADALNEKSYGNDGLIQRLQMVIFPKQQKYKAVDEETKVPDKLQAFFIELYQHLSQATESNRGYVPLIYRVDESATDYWMKWLDTWMAMVGDENEPHIAGHLSKYRSLMAGLSLVFSLMNGRERVALEDMELAAGWCDYLTLHARKMYRCSEEGTYAAKLADKIKSGKVKDGTTLRLLKSNNVLGKNKNMFFDKTMDELIAANWVRIETVSHGSKILRINPSIKIKGGQS